MPKQLAPLTVAAPGFLGLNTQQSGNVLPAGWATKATNFVYDEVGRLACRNGSQQLNASALTSSPTIRQVHEYVDNSGNTLTILAAGNKIYKEVSGTMTDISGTITTPTADNWQFANFNDWVVGFQDNHAPIVLTTTGGTFANSGGTQYNGDMVLSAYGRIWTVVDSVLYYSDLLINNFTGGSSGNFDLAKFWPDGMDEAVALADFNGLLIVFGKRSILVYENADDVSNMVLVEGIGGIGCIARDSVQVIGNDIVFLSDGGIRTLSRSLTDGGSMPMGDVSKHVRDDVVGKAASETKGNIKSVYHESDGYYLLSLPASGLSYYFDLKFPNQDGSWKATTWDIAPTALHWTKDNTLKLAVDAGYLSKSVAFKDGLDSSGSGGSSYTIDYEGPWVDFGDEVANYLKIPKNVSLLASGVTGSPVTFKWAVDYADTFNTRTLAFTTTAPAQYGSGQYGISTYASQGSFERVRSTLARSGQVLKMGVTATINGSSFALQRFDVLAKIGRLAL